MFKHFITTTLRHLWRNKFFTALNMLGLSIGISAALVIGLIVHYEYSFDTFQPDRDRIYRILPRCFRCCSFQLCCNSFHHTSRRCSLPIFSLGRNIWLCCRRSYWRSPFSLVVTRPSSCLVMY